MHNSSCFWNPIATNLLETTENSWDLQKRTFIPFFRPFEPNWVTKSYFQWNLRFQDCLITRWLQTASTHVLIERIYCYQHNSNYLKNRKFFATFFLHFRNLQQIPNVLRKKWASYLKCFWSCRLREMCLFKSITVLVSETLLQWTY